MNIASTDEGFPQTVEQRSPLKRARALLEDTLRFGDEDTLSYGRARAILRAHNLTLSTAGARYVMRSVAQHSRYLELCGGDGAMLRPIR